MRLSEFISPDVNVARSVNLERDMGAETTLKHYHLTGKGLEILSRLIAALGGERVSAWSLTGPYGMGKSSFANFLLALCGPQDDVDTRIAWRMLQRRDLHLSRQLHQLLTKHAAGTTGLFRVAVTSSFESINRTLANGIRRALLAAKHRSRLRRENTDLLSRAEDLCAQAQPETARLMDLFRDIQRFHGAPVALVIDEFGKNLEYMARFPAQGDLFILQMLAESEGFFTWVCLHQAFEEYTSRLSARQLQEWGKIQGRFEDISFVEPKSEMIRFTCETLVRKADPPHLKQLVRAWAEAYHKEAMRLDLSELRGVGVDIMERLYPLHPLAAVALPELCTRFAQNDRTLFAFLCSGEPAALPAFLASEIVDPSSRHLATFGPERLYDYFLSSGTGSLLARPESHRWIEIHDIIERSRNVDPSHFSVLKVIGLLNLISGPSGFRASNKLLSFAIFRLCSNSDTPETNLGHVLQSNKDKGVLIYREYADEYRLWEGTDFDIPKAVRERRAILATQPLAAILKEPFPLPPLTASKHSYLTGTLRHFERRWCGEFQATEPELQCSAKEVDGLLLYCFGREPTPPDFPSRTPDGRPVIVCYVPCEDQIRDAVLDSAAAKAVLRESPELVRDGVARKEARFRARAAEERLRTYLNTIFAPGNEEARWVVMGKRQDASPGSHKDLSRLLSECCDRVYCHCPRIRNELINRNRLSTAAARARRELTEAMVLRESHPMLGFEGTGPEVAIYRTMLLAEGLHREGPDGSWQFTAPGPESCYHATWRAVTGFLERAGDQSVALSDVIAMLRYPPFGMKEGPIPILLCLFLLVHSDEVALYQEGGFIPFLGPEEMELMTKRPEYFSIRRFQQQWVRGQVFQLYTSLLQAQPKADGGQLRNATLIGVVGPLVQFVKGLKPYALHTKSVSTHARNVRQALLLAKDPFDLLYVDLPRAVDMPPFEDKGNVPEMDLLVFRDRFAKAVIELREAYPRLIESIRQVVLHAFGETGDVRRLRQQLKQRASKLLDRTSDQELRPILGAMTAFTGSDEDWLVAMATIVSQRPVDSWRETDLQGFAVRMQDLAGRIAAMETILARTERVLPEAVDGRRPRMVTLTESDGSMASRILWQDEAATGKAENVVARLLEEWGDDRSALETIFIVLSNRLISGRSGVNEEENNEH